MNDKLKFDILNLKFNIVVIYFPMLYGNNGVVTNTRHQFINVSNQWKSMINGYIVAEKKYISLMTKLLHMKIKKLPFVSTNDMDIFKNKLHILKFFINNKEISLGETIEYMENKKIELIEFFENGE